MSHDSETPAHGKQAITACAFIHHLIGGEVKVFLPRRADTKKFLPGVFEIPGGHIDFGEDMVQGLKREIFEEFGARISVGDPFAVFSYVNEVKGSHSIEVVYFAQFEDPIRCIKLNPEDHSSYNWFAENELETVASANKRLDDPEIQVMRKGFALLRGQKPAFR